MEITIRSLATALVAVALLTMPSSADTPAVDPFVKKDAPAPAPAEGPISNVVFTVEIYTTSQAEGAAILQGESSDQARYQRVLDLVKAGKANFDDVLAATCTSGQQAVVEDCAVLSYPINWTVYADRRSPDISEYKQRNIGRRLVYRAVPSQGNNDADLSAFVEGSTLRAMLGQPLTGGGTLFRPQFDVRRMGDHLLLPVGKMSFLGTATSGATAETSMTLVFGRIDFVALAPDPAPKSTPSVLENQFSLYSMSRDQAEAVLHQSPQPGSVFAAVQAYVARKEATLEHVTVIRGNGGEKMTADEVCEFPYPTSFSATESVTQDFGFSAQATTKFIANTSLVSVDVTKLQWLKYRGHVKGATVTSEYGPAPYFEIQSLVTSVNAPLGENEFVGTISPPENVGVTGLKATGQVWLAFVKTTVASP